MMIAKLWIALKKIKKADKVESFKDVHALGVKAGKGAKDRLSNPYFKFTVKGKWWDQGYGSGLVSKHNDQINGGM